MFPSKTSSKFLNVKKEFQHFSIIWILDSHPTLFLSFLVLKNVQARKKSFFPPLNEKLIQCCFFSLQDDTIRVDTLKQYQAVLLQIAELRMSCLQRKWKILERIYFPAKWKMNERESKYKKRIIYEPTTQKIHSSISSRSSRWW